MAERHIIRRGAPVLLLLCCGCFAPMKSPGIPAAALSDEFRLPSRTMGSPINYSSLLAPPPSVYFLGAGDVLEITAPDLIQRGDAHPIRAIVTDTGEIHLPRVGAIPVAGLTLSQAQQRLNDALGANLLANPGATLTLIEKGTVNVLVLGAVRQPGVHALPRFEHDIGHALAAAGGLAEEAGGSLQVHRSHAASSLAYFPAPGVPHRLPVVPATYPSPISSDVSQASWNSPPASSAARNGLANPSFGPHARPSTPYQSYRGGVQPASYAAAAPTLAQPPPAPYEAPPSPARSTTLDSSPILSIPLRGADHVRLTPDQVILRPGDVLVVPPRQNEVFYVVGKLSETNRVRFSVGDVDRMIGNGFLLPPDRDIDVVTAVAMAGYIDPIDSPTTVTVHRVQPDGIPLLVRVDLIRARTDPRETLIVQPGDIIYLNPDWPWYWRRLCDRVVHQALGTAIGRWLTQ